MTRARRVAEIWNWLPAFRVVAEHESIHKAAVVLHVSASALSRTVRLIEDAVGEALFVRAASGLVITTFGTELLKGTRDAMRRIDDVAATVSPCKRGSKRLVVGASGAALPCLLARAVGRATRMDTLAHFRVVALDEESAVAELLRGNADVVLLEADAPSAPAEIACDALGELRFALYAPAGVSEDAPVVALDGLAFDAARVAAVAPSVDLVVRIAEEGELLALLQVGFAPPPFHMVTPTDARISVHALTRRPLDTSSADEDARALLDAVRALLSGH